MQDATSFPRLLHALLSREPDVAHPGALRGRLGVCAGGLARRLGDTVCRRCRGSHPRPIGACDAGDRRAESRGRRGAAPPRPCGQAGRSGFAGGCGRARRVRPDLHGWMPRRLRRRLLQRHGRSLVLRLPAWASFRGVPLLPGRAAMSHSRPQDAEASAAGASAGELRAADAAEIFAGAHAANALPRATRRAGRLAGRRGGRFSPRAEKSWPRLARGSIARPGGPSAAASAAAPRFRSGAGLLGSTAVTFHASPAGANQTIEQPPAANWGLCAGCGLYRLSAS